jgi:hypothetical protein
VCEAGEWSSGMRPNSRWRAGMSSFSFLPPFLMGKRENDAKKAEKLKEAVNQVKEPLKSDKVQFVRSTQFNFLYHDKVRSNQ